MFNNRKYKILKADILDEILGIGNLSGNGTNTMLDVFCRHAPLGLNFPAMTDYDSARYVTSHCKNTTYDAVLASFTDAYRKKVWARQQNETNL